MNKITIVGGGTAGLASALILRARFPIKEINIIKSDKLGIIGVGEGSTEHWSQFMQLCDISPIEVLKECDATLKLGVMFKDWKDKPYFHSVSDIHTQQKFGQYQAVFGEFINSNTSSMDMVEQVFHNNEIPVDIEHNFRANQFHLNTFKLNEFLIKKCNERNITIINDEIMRVFFADEQITELVGSQGRKYQSDFWIDCTGFKRLLISKLGAKWQSYKEHLILNHAIAFPTDDTDNYNVYSLSKAMKYGWMWRVPVYGRWGNGYIFDDTCIDAEQAQKEVEEYLGYKVNIFKDIKFDPGALDKVWIKNCMAVGLSANFMEPLEASSIGTSLNQMFMLMHVLENHTQQDIDDFNNKMKDIMNNVRDFVFVHYMLDRQDTEFWQKVSKIEPPETLKKNLAKWKHRLPIREDFKGTDYHLFFEYNWASVLHGIGLFDTDSIKKEYNSYNEIWKQDIKREISNWKNSQNTQYISHKEFLTKVRNENSIS